MAEEKIKSAEVMSDKDLDGVAGGTNQQKNEIIAHLSKATPDLMTRVHDIAVGHIDDGVDSDIAVNLAPGQVLKENYEINASILNWKLPNKYEDLNGNTISHAEVLNMIDVAGDFVII